MIFLKRDAAIQLFLCALCFSSVMGATPTMQELFLRANSLYEQGQFQQALTTYQAITPKGSAPWYNMGLCWHRLGNKGQALVCWRQAERTASIDESYRITQAINALVHTHEAEHTPDFFSSSLQLLRTYVRVIPPMIFQLLMVLGLCLLFFYSKWWYYGVHGKSLILGACCITVLCAAGMYLQYQERQGNRGVVVATCAPVYSGPDTQFHERGMLAQATEVAIHKTAGSWYKVAQGDTSGWVMADAIVVV